jgi:hypothetical protein
MGMAPAAAIATHPALAKTRGLQGNMLKLDGESALIQIKDG